MLSTRASLKSSNSSTNTLQVPDFSSTERLDTRRRSLNSLLQETQNRSVFYGNRRSSAPPNRRASCGWGPVWELRKQFARHKRRLSSDEYQVILLIYSAKRSLRIFYEFFRWSNLDQFSLF